MKLFAVILRYANNRPSKKVFYWGLDWEDARLQAEEYDITGARWYCQSTH